MMKKIVTVLGLVFVLVGIAGFAAPHLGGAHLSPAHNLVHLVSGALALYFGLKGTWSGARVFCVVFGIVYGLLGVAGILAGQTDERMLTLIPGTLELGRVDHIIHMALGLIFLGVGLAAQPMISARAQA